MDTVNTTTEKETAMTTTTAATAAELRTAADALREQAARLDEQAQIAADAEFAADLARARAENRVVTNRVVWKDIAVGDVVAVINNNGGEQDQYVTVERVVAIIETSPVTLRVQTEWEFTRVSTRGTSVYDVDIYDMVTKIN